MLKSPSLRMTILLGFGTVVALLMALAVSSYRGTNLIGDDFTEYREIARQGLATNQLNSSMLQARLAVMQYRITNDPIYVDRVHEIMDHLEQAKTDLISVIRNPEKLAAMEGLQTLTGDYQAAFNEVVALQEERNRLVPILDEAGRASRQNISQIMQLAFQEGDADTAYYAGVLQQSLMLARYYTGQYLLNSQSVDQARAVEEIRLVDEGFNRLDGQLQGATQRASLNDFVDNWSMFAQTFTRVAVIVDERNALMRDRLDHMGPGLAESYADVLAISTNRQNTVGPRAAAEVATVSRNTIVLAVVASLLGVLAALWISRFISQRIVRVVRQMTALADGALDITITGTQRTDELGDMARALKVFQSNGRRKVELEREHALQAERADKEKRASMNAMADSFNACVDDVISGVSSAAEQMVGLARSMAAAADRANERSSAVASASHEASTNVEMVAAASEQMTNSIAEVSQRIGQSAEMTENAARGAQETTQTVSKLATSAQTIGEVISMISAIAEQTNLLALNATIEAARAGEAGKGFAVVASEVKSLANQTATATEEISAQITAMQTDTDAVVGAIGSIGTMIEDLNATSSSISEAVDEQHAATEEIARNTQQAADGTRSVSSNISDVSTAVQETGQAANDVLAASSQLASEAERLRTNVADFLNTVRAA